MDRITKSLLNEFVQENELDTLPEDRASEAVGFFRKRNGGPEGPPLYLYFI